MGLAITTSLTSSLLHEPLKSNLEPDSATAQAQISVEGKWAAGLAIYGHYASDSSASAASTVMGGFAALAAVIPGGQFAAGYYGL